MKKTLLMLSLVVVMLGLGVAQASAAVPVIDGLLGAGADFAEWNNNAYEYYLHVTDVNEPGITDTYDISDIVLLQELANADSGKDGVYFMLTTYATPPSLVDVDATAVRASLALFGDFNGNGTADDASFPFPADVQIYVTNVSPTGAIAGDKVYWCSGAAGSCDAINGTLIWDAGAATGSTPDGFQYARGADAIEMFLRTGTFGTPEGVQFPSTFYGCASYDDGSTNPDDQVCGTNAIIPEPGTMFMALTGLLGLAGAGKLKFWN